MKKLVTAESVGEGHPDKVCDKISDAILDDLIRQDPESRVAVECLTKNGMIIAAGEVRTTGYADIQRIVRTTLKDIGYTDPRFGIDYEDCAVLSAIQEQSPDIAGGVDAKEGKEQGAGDQGIMFGYACNETPELMPLPILLSHKLMIKSAELRKKGELRGCGPDSKSQVTVEYEDGKPKRVHTAVIAQQHLAELSEQELEKEVIEKVIKPVLGNYMDENTIIHVNSSGRFVIGGPEGDAGVTGRKIIFDSYGGGGKHGGGAFSGKDPSKVDRSATYAARYIAKNLVAAGVSDEIEVQLSYTLGIAEPLSINVETFGKGKVPEDRIVEIIKKVFPIRPADIINQLQLKRPVYYKTAAYGHFGRDDPDFSWEKLDKVDEVKSLL
ncbi:MAG: methionine adenosyltransferase [archaeon]|nr:MAG: methionine adenosyltransferase [archaeon]